MIPVELMDRGWALRIFLQRLLAENGQADHVLERSAEEHGLLDVV